MKRPNDDVIAGPRCRSRARETLLAGRRAGFAPILRRSVSYPAAENEIVVIHSGRSGKSATLYLDVPHSKTINVWYVDRIGPL